MTMMSRQIAAKMVDKLEARGLIYGTLNGVRREARINDIIATYQEYDQRVVYEVFVDWLDTHDKAPHPKYLKPRIEAIMRKQTYRGEALVLTAEQITELRALCKRFGANGRAWMEYALEGDRWAEGREDAVPKIRGPFDEFKQKVELALVEGRLG